MLAESRLNVCPAPRPKTAFPLGMFLSGTHSIPHKLQDLSDYRQYIEFERFPIKESFVLESNIHNTKQQDWQSKISKTVAPKRDQKQGLQWCLQVCLAKGKSPVGLATLGGGVTRQAIQKQG